MILIYSEYWDELTMFYYNENMILMQQVCSSSGEWRDAHPSAIFNLDAIRLMFPKSTIYDDKDEEI